MWAGAAEAAAAADLVRRKTETFFFVGKVILYGFMCYLTLYYADLKVLQILD